MFKGNICSSMVAMRQLNY